MKYVAVYIMMAFIFYWCQLASSDFDQNPAWCHLALKIDFILAEEWVGLGTGWMRMVVVVASSEKALVKTRLAISLLFWQQIIGLENVIPLLTL